MYSREVTKSWNHTVVEDGRDLCRSPGPTPLLSQGHLELIAHVTFEGKGNSPATPHESKEVVNSECVCYNILNT